MEKQRKWRKYAFSFVCVCIFKVSFRCFVFRLFYLIFRHAYMFRSNLLLPSPCKPLSLYLHVLSLFSSYLLSSLLVDCTGAGPSAGTPAASQGSADGSGTSWTPSPIHMEIVASLVVCTQSQLCRGHVCDGCVPPLTSCTVIYSLSLTNFLTPLLRWFLNFGWRSVT